MVAALVQIQNDSYFCNDNYTNIEVITLVYCFPLQVFSQELDMFHNTVVISNDIIIMLKCIN